MNLQSWSWQDLHKIYKVYSYQLLDYKYIADRFELKLPLELKPGEIIQYADGSEQFIHHFYVGVRRINDQLSVLDQEIKRRNNLIGVMG